MRFEDELMNEHRHQQATRVSIILKLYSMVGLLMAILGSVYFAITLLPQEMTQDQRMAFMVASLGVIVGALSKTMLTIQVERAKLREQKISVRIEQLEFLDAWNDFEIISKNALQNEGETFDRYSVKSVINKLMNDGKLDNIDILKLEESLLVRNQIVHERRSPSGETLKQIINSLSEISKKIML